MRNCPRSRRQSLISLRDPEPVGPENACDKVNPGSFILSGEMMLRYLGWTKAADRIITSMNKTITSKRVTYDFARLIYGATEVKCSEFGDAMVKNL